jgi:hypothetical protein
MSTITSREFNHDPLGPHGPLLATVNRQLMFDQPVDGRWASDHFGVLADLTTPPHPPGTWR